MTRLFIILTSILLSTQLIGQTEFEIHKNGLIYSEKTMTKLSTIVDSLNLKYKVCDLNKVFYSKSQTKGLILRLDTNDIKQAKKDMDKNMSFPSFMAKYPNCKIKKEVLIVNFKYKNYKNENVSEFSEIKLNSNYGFEIRVVNQKDKDKKSLKNTWLYDYRSKTDYSNEYLEAFYFPEEFESKPLELKYSRKIGYSNCLIDTVTTKFKEDLVPGSVNLPKKWQTLPLKKQKILLENMRSTRVVGGCSMDTRPRTHAINIALLSAETTNWSVFLKSHLDIMNDRFDRMSDGSYAWSSRKTYIKELEELDINVLDLLIGITLRIENPAENHYFGNISRLGRAITESNNKDEFEKQMLLMIEDSTLDNYNRILLYFLFKSYTNYHESEAEQKKKLIKLNKAIQTLPNYLKTQIETNKD